MADLPPAGTLPAGTPGAPARPTGWRRVLPLVLLIGLIAGCTVWILFRLGSDLGPVAFAVGLAAALIPVPLLVLTFLWLDRYEPEPVVYLLLCFGWGAAVATTVASQVNTWSADLFDRVGLPDALVAVLVAPVIEETMKAGFPLLLLWRRRREISGITDGIVYCGLSATGFAMVENILYLGGYGWNAGDKYGPASAANMVIIVFIGRILFSAFAHPLFTSMTGIGLGTAARSADRRVRWLAPLAGLIVAMMLHGSWNLMAVLSSSAGQPLIQLYGYFAVMVPIFLAMIGFAIWLRSREGRLTERTLPVYVRAGWLSPPEVAALATLGRRYSARRWARRVAGDAGSKAMRDYQYAATRLALLRDGVERGLDRTPAEVAQTAADERRLLDTIALCRNVFTGRDPQAPAAVWDGARYHVTFPDGQRRPLDPPPEPVVPIPVLLAPPPGLYPPPGFRGYR